MITSVGSPLHIQNVVVILNCDLPKTTLDNSIWVKIMEICYGTYILWVSFIDKKYARGDDIFYCGFFSFLISWPKRM